MVNSSGAVQMEMTLYMVVTTLLEQTMEWALGPLGRGGTRGRFNRLDRIGLADVNIVSGRD